MGDYIKSALNVNGNHPLLSFDDDIFLMDNWSDSEGLKYLIGIAQFTQDKKTGDFSELITLESETYDESETDYWYILAAFRKAWNRLNRLWSSSPHPSLNPPNYYIEWALSKGVTIPWLNYAIKKGFYKSETHLTQAEKPIFDKDSSAYPVELDYAFRAWQAVTSNLGKGKPKSQIMAWLNTNAKELSHEAKKRISIVANWDKLGGATRTD